MTGQSKNTNEGFLSFNDACQYLQVKSSKLYQLTHKKEITFYKPAGKLYFKKSDLDEWIQSAIVKPSK